MAVVLGRPTIAADRESEGHGPLYLQRLLPRLVRIVTGQTLAPFERAEAGRALAHLGDPRPEVGAVRLEAAEGAPLLAMQFCYVPRGPFWMGSPDDDELANDDEKPLHQADIPYDYWLSRYPVTVAQFQAFIAAGGYRQERYWPEARANGYWEGGQVKRYIVVDEGGEWKAVEELAAAPYDYGPPFNLPNHPVVGLSWYESLAFCHWLTETLGRGGYLPATWRASLPGEAEWEKAARGGLRVPLKARVAAVGEPDFVLQPEMPLKQNADERRPYPWGAEADPNRANYRATGLNTTSAVGCFPAGASPYGVEELAGNVWEWCSTKWQRNYEHYQDDNDLAEYTDRVLRGGAYYSDGPAVRCGSRYRSFPGYLGWYSGFRVALSPRSLNSDPSGR